MALAAPAAGAAGASSQSESAIVVVSGDVTVKRGETVDGVFIASGDARIAGRVDGDVIVLSGDVIVSGSIDGDLFTAGGEARLLPSAEVTGDVEYGDEHPAVALDARVNGEVTKQDWPDVGGLISWVGGIVVWLAIGLSLLILGACSSIPISGALGPSIHSCIASHSLHALSAAWISSSVAPLSGLKNGHVSSGLMSYAALAFNQPVLLAANR